MFGLTALGTVAVIAAALTAFVQIANIVRRDKAYQARRNNKKK